MNPHDNQPPVSQQDELRERGPAQKLAEYLLTTSAPTWQYDYVIRLAKQLLAQHAQPEANELDTRGVQPSVQQEAPVGLKPELTLGDLDAALVNYDSGYTRREVVLMRLNSMLRTRTALLTAQHPVVLPQQMPEKEPQQVESVNYYGGSRYERESTPPVAPGEQSLAIEPMDITDDEQVALEEIIADRHAPPAQERASDEHECINCFKRWQDGFVPKDGEICSECAEILKPVLATAAKLAREEALEEAAVLTEKGEVYKLGEGRMRLQISAAIRALAAQPAPQKEKRK